MPYNKDTAVIVIEEGEDGHVAKYYLFQASPPKLPNGLDRYITSAVPEPTQQTRVSTDKPSLKTEIGAFIDNFYAQP